MSDSNLPSPDRLEAVKNMVRETLRDHKLIHQTVDGSADFLPLLNALTPSGDSCIVRGNEEVWAIAESVAEALCNTPPVPVPAADPVSDALEALAGALEVRLDSKSGEIVRETIRDLWPKEREIDAS